VSHSVVRQPPAVAAERRPTMWQLLARTLGGAVRVARARWLFRRCTTGRRVHASGYVRVVAEGTIRLGERVNFLAGVIPSEIVAHPGAQIVVGAGTWISASASIEAFHSIRIGRGCMLAPFSRVCDREAHNTAPIVIGDDVWVAHGAIIEPGVSIGDRSVISAGSVVTRNVPADMLAMGNPARYMSVNLAPENTARIGDASVRPARDRAGT
jgi:acetyltransferase-like isoleucine patch superfamily enzyme